MIERSLILVGACFALLFMTTGAMARIDIAYEAPVTVCPVRAGDIQPDFSGSGCEKMELYAVDPQGRDIWVQILFIADASSLPANGPIGLFISAKSSSAAWLNGVYLGANGAPGETRASETPGRMDAVLYVPHEAIKSGQNELVLRLSSHHGFLHLGYPIHWISFSGYVDPSREILRAYGPSLMTFGAFLIGAIYFGVASVRGGLRNNGLLLLLSLIAIAQLGLETARGLFPYAYPFHDWRLVLITAGVASFGLCLLFHTAFRFLVRFRTALLAGSAIATGLAIHLTDSFDAKAIHGLLIPTAMSACIAIYAAMKKRPMARAYAAALVMFIALMLIFGGGFLDTAFFYSVAALILFLIGQQAVVLSQERALRLDASDRARRLELALEQARQKDAPERLTIHSAGKTEIIAASDIIYCKGAGDYAEIVLASGACHLHLAKLQDLESELPNIFLRVHRSYIVNTSYVQSLTRESNGVGALALTNGASIPVSRRILPNVRSALQ